MCCGSSFTVIPIHCSTMSTYSALTQSSQSFDEYTALVTSSLSAVNPPVSSVPLMRTHLSLTHGYTHFTNSTINTDTSVLATPSSSYSVPVTSTIISFVVPAVVGTTLLCLMVAAVFGSILALVLCRTKRKQFPVTNNSDQISQQRYTLLVYVFQEVFQHIHIQSHFVL